MLAGCSLGVDAVSVARMALAARRSGERFLGRVFTPLELACSRDPGFLASRFAAKEAFFKALGTGLDGGVSWLDFEYPRGGPAPSAPVISGRSRQLLGGRRVLADVAWTETCAVAVVLLTRDGEDPRGGSA